MAAWAGFSDEDLRKVKNITNTNTQRPARKGRSPEVVKKATFGRDKHETLTAKRSGNLSNTVTKHSDIDPAMKLQKQQNESTPVSHKIPKERNEVKPGVEQDVKDSSGNVETGDESSEDKLLDDKEALERDMKSLEVFRTQQKAIEEANKQKKALLAKTLTERKKRAQKETYKLEHIQKELSKLDTLLTADVQVIRNKIEDASRDFLDAQRRFERAEVEYVAAKVDLHSKSELKEHLTEHLYTIIHQNEVRKAKKLADLMKELEMENSEEEFCLPELPPLSSFQPATKSPTGSLSFLNRSPFKDSSDVPQTVSQQDGESQKDMTVSQTLHSDQGQTGNQSDQSKNDKQSGDILKKEQDSTNETAENAKTNTESSDKDLKTGESKTDSVVAIKDENETEASKLDLTEESTKKLSESVNIVKSSGTGDDKVVQVNAVDTTGHGKTETNSKVRNGDIVVEPSESLTKAALPDTWVFNSGKS